MVTYQASPPVSPVLQKWRMTSFLSQVGSTIYSSIYILLLIFHLNKLFIYCFSTEFHFIDSLSFFLSGYYVRQERTRGGGEGEGREEVGDRKKEEGT